MKKLALVVGSNRDLIGHLVDKWCRSGGGAVLAHPANQPVIPDPSVYDDEIDFAARCEGIGVHLDSAKALRTVMAARLCRAITYHRLIWSREAEILLETTRASAGAIEVLFICGNLPLEALKELCFAASQQGQRLLIVIGGIADDLAPKGTIRDLQIVLENKALIIPLTCKCEGTSSLTDLTLLTAEHMVQVAAELASA